MRTPLLTQWYIVLWDELLAIWKEKDPEYKGLIGSMDWDMLEQG